MDGSIILGGDGAGAQAAPDTTSLATQGEQPSQAEQIAQAEQGEQLAQAEIAQADQPEQPEQPVFRGSNPLLGGPLNDGPTGDLSANGQGNSLFGNSSHNPSSPFTRNNPFVQPNVLGERSDNGPGDGDVLHAVLNTSPPSVTRTMSSATNAPNGSSSAPTGPNPAGPGLGGPLGGGQFPFGGPGGGLGGPNIYPPPQESRGRTNTDTNPEDDLPPPPNSSPVDNRPLVAHPVGNQSATEDTGFGFTVPANTFADAEAGPLTYSATLADGTLAEDAALSQWFQSGTIVQDVDGGDVITASLTFSTPSAVLMIPVSGGTVTNNVFYVTGTASQVETALKALQLRTAADWDQNLTGTVTVRDAAGTGFDVPVTVTVTAANDTLHEAAETFTVALINPVNATVGTATGTATITDNDAQPTLNVSGGTVSEAGSFATFTLTLSAASGVAVTADYATANGSALAGSDFTATASSTTFPPGETQKTVQVPIINDTAWESAETLTLSVSNVVGAAIGTGTATATITDNEQAVPSVSVASGTGSEMSGVLSFVVSLSTSSDQTVTVDWATADGSATFDFRDYVSNSGTLTFEPGETTRTIQIKVNDETSQEGAETVA